MLRQLRRAAVRLALAALGGSAGLAVAQGPVVGPPQNISVSSNGSVLPSLAAAPDGVHAFWHDFTGATNLVWCSTNAGTGWSASGPCPPNVTQSWSPRAVADRVGNIHVAWRDRTAGNDEIFYARWSGSAWSTPVNISNTAAPSGNPAITEWGTFPHVAWEEGPAGSKRFFEAWWDGVAWVPARDTGFPFVQAAALDTLRIGYDSGGTLHAVWHDGATSLTEIWHAEQLPGGAWGAPENLSNTPGSLSAEPALGFGPTGTTYVAWIEQDPVLASVFETCLMERPWGGAWGPKQDVSRQGSWCYRPAVAADSLGPRIAWHVETGAGQEVFYASSPAATPVNVSLSDGVDSSRVALVIDAGSESWLAWVEGNTAAAEIYAATTAEGSVAGPILLMVTKDEIAGDVLLSWTGGASPWHVHRGAAPRPGDPSWAELTLPAGTTTPAAVDAGVLRDGVAWYYDVR